MDPIQGKLIWKSHKPYNHTHTPDPEKTRVEFPDLIRFKGEWYCAFREGEIHDAHPSGKGRIIRSSDGENWETAAFLEWDGGDVREPKFSITAEGMLMVNTSIYFVSKEPRADGYFYQLDQINKILNSPEDDLEPGVTLQSVTWLTADGRNWSTAYACPTGVNTWRWMTAWHNGMGYSIGEWGKDAAGTIYRTRDGKSWRVLRENLFPEGHAGEGALAFGKDDAAYCLLRGGTSQVAFIGKGMAPYYQDWEWKSPKVNWEGKLRPIREIYRVQLGGPKLICLNDGRLLGAGRTLGPERPDGPWRADPSDPQGKEDGRVTLFWVDAEKAIFTQFVEMDGSSYPGVVEHDGHIWISYIGGDRSGVFLAKVKLPAKEAGK